MRVFTFQPLQVHRCVLVFRFKFLDCKIPVSSFRLPVSHPVKVQVQVQVLMYQFVLLPNFASQLFPLLVTSTCVLVDHFVTLIMSSCTNVCMHPVSRIIFHAAYPSRPNIPLWRQYLHDYPDARICDFLEYGWPVGYDYSTQGFPVSQLRNHQGALLFPDAIDSYLQNEICRNAVLGPFETNPFSCPVALSPLNSMPKQDSTERRIIVDLSWLAGTSVNDGISSSSYLGEDISLTYPTVDSIASLIWSVGSGCLLYKRDFKCAYRQFPVYPLDYPLLGYCWKHSLYFDLVLPMGLRSAAMACQRITNAVCYICEMEGHHTLSYLDDFIGVATPDIA